jgi:hypothetical protein
MTTYRSEHAAAMLARITELLPAAEILDPEALAWESDRDWLAAWPDVLESLEGIVVFSARDGSVGVGCVTEATDALARSVPAAVLSRSGLRALEGFRLLSKSERSARRFARLIPGSHVEASEFPGGRP